MKFLIYIGGLFVLLPAIKCYNILLLIPFTGSSHWLFFEHFIRELDFRGHSVTCITGKPLTGKISSNYTEIPIDPPYDLVSAMDHDTIYKGAYVSDTANIQWIFMLGLTSSEHSLRDKNVQKFIHRNDLHFDLIISEQFFQESWLLFAYKHNAPILTISTYGMSDFFDRMHGHLTPWSHVPHMVLTYSDNMSFTERLYNVYVSAYDFYYRKYYYLKEQNKLAEKYFSHLQRNGESLPTVEELEQSVSLTLVNDHRSVAIPRPAMPGIVYVGGAHVKPPKAIPTDIKRFLDGAEHGVIYFSLGATMKSSTMPKDKIAVFLETFGKLKQRVLWKFEDESLEKIPENVMVRKWLPQSDIFAHKHVILFISHGGLFGNLEALHRGIPILFIPLYGDQYRNALRAEIKGFGTKIIFNDLTTEVLLKKIQQLTDTKVYYNKAQEISALIRDNPIEPMDEAMFWIEYVCRHKGAKHLKSHAIHMSWYSYLLLDIVSVIVVSGILLGLIVFKLFKLVFKSQSRKNLKKDE